MITPKMKDDVLKHLVEAEVAVTHHNVDANPILDDTGISLSDFNGILLSFNNSGIIEYKGLSRGHYFDVLVNESAHDKLYKGGYQMEELILEHELTKLHNEIEELNKNFSKENLLKVTGIASNLTSLLSLFLKK